MIPEQHKEPVSIQQVHETYKKWLYVKDDRRIDVGLAVALSRILPGTKLWLVIVGDSGDWKSEQVGAIAAWRPAEKTRILAKLTSKTLVSGSPKFPDLAPELKDKVVIIKDFAEILYMHQQEKTEILSQLRELYDGNAGKDSGAGKRVYYEGLNITLISASTPVIYTHTSVMNSMGTRELFWRTETLSEEEKRMIARKSWANEEHETKMRHELGKITAEFLEEKEKILMEALGKGMLEDDNSIDKIINIPHHVQEEILLLANYLSMMRAGAEVDTYTGELISPAMPERPTRIVKQLKRLYRCLKILDPAYEEVRAMGIIRHIIHSCSNDMRQRVILSFLANPREHTQYSMAKDLRVGKKTAFRELNVLWNLGLLKREERGDEGWRETHYFSLNFHNPLVIQLAEEFKIKEHTNDAERMIRRLEEEKI